jgi:hypothetical protein
MTKLVLPAQSAAFHKYWVAIPPVKTHLFSRSVAKSLPLSSTFEIKYLNLISKIDLLASVPGDGEDSEYHIAEPAVFTARQVIKELSKQKIIENNIGVYLFANLEKGIQIELDGDFVKADIEILEDSTIILTTYRGERNTTSEYQLTTESLYLLNEFLNINELEYA